MTATYEKIATTTLGSASASVTFSSISGSYTDLVLIINAGVTVANRNLNIQFNSDTGNNYSFTNIIGNGSSASSVRYSNQPQAFLTDSAMDTNNYGNVVILHLNNYSNTTTYKTGLFRNSRAAGYAEAGVIMWRSTNAITSMNIQSAGANLLSGSTFTLYGILKA